MTSHWKKVLLLALAIGVGTPLAGCDKLGLGGSEKAKKDKSSDEDEDEDEQKKKKKKKKSDEDEDEDKSAKKDKDKDKKDTPAAAPTPEPPKTAEPPKGESFAGRYRSTYGDVRITHAGDRVKGTYPGGTLDCSVDGKKLDCDWKDSAGIGKARLEKQANGDLKGTWGNGASYTNGGGWLFTLLEAGEPGPSGEEAKAGEFAGIYVSTWGDTVFKEDGSKITGTYPGGRLDCVANGPVLDCNWKDSAGVGKAKLTRQANGNISGTWGFGASYTDGGSWLFRKK
jgi:hypothetical protein